MAKRAYSPKDVAQIRYRSLPLEGRWREVFGEPELGDTWFIMGPSASGKSSFVMQLAKMLCGIGPVLYVSLEEGVGLSMQRRLSLFKMNEVQGKLRITTDPDIESLGERLAKPKSAKFIIVDSYQYAYDAGWEYKQTRALVERFKRKTFIFVSQEEKGLPLGKPAGRIQYMAGVKVRTSMYRAYCKGRYSTAPGAYFSIWPEKEMELTNQISAEARQNQAQSRMRTLNR